MNDTNRPMLLTIPQTASELSIAVSLAYEMARDGRLPAVRIGKAVRIPRRSLENWIAERVQDELAKR